MLKHSIFILSALSFSRLCRADTVVLSESFSLIINNATTTVLPLASQSNDQETLIFGQFNPGLGTLTSVEFTLIGSTQSQSLSVSGTRGNTRFFTVTSAGETSGLSTIPFNGGTATLISFLDLITATCTTPISGSTSCSSTENDSASVPGSLTLFNTTGYAGLGTFQVNLGLFAGRSNPAGICALCGIVPTNRFADIDATWSGTLQVAYNYEPSPIPEPSTWAITAGGILLLWGAGRYGSRGR